MPKIDKQQFPDTVLGLIGMGNVKGTQPTFDIQLTNA